MVSYFVMHIYFIDQAETRTEALVQEAVKNRHMVTVTSTPYTLLSCIFALFSKPNIIHVHSWKGALFLRISMPFFKNTPCIWTIAELPRFSSLLPYIATKFDTICTTSRTLQYQLLTQYSLKSEYIPDGYSVPVLPDIRPALFNLRKEQYGVLLSDNVAQIKQISAIFKTLKTKKKLVIFSKSKWMGITSIDVPPTSRSAQSIIRQAGFVISTEPAYSPLLLQAMDSGRHVIATTESLHEELLGTTAQYYQENDSIGLLILLSNALKKHSVNASAQTRAKNHFSWDKIGQEYMRAYKHSKAVLVPFDSIVPKNSFQRAV